LQNKPKLCFTKFILNPKFYNIFVVFTTTFNSSRCSKNIGDILMNLGNNCPKLHILLNQPVKHF
jgi:hypothetical protein